MKQQRLELIQEDPTRVKCLFWLSAKAKKSICSRRHNIKEALSSGANPRRNLCFYLYWYNSCQNTPAF